MMLPAYVLVPVALAATTIATLPEPAARVVGHEVVVDALQLEDGHSVTLGADGLVVRWDGQGPAAWTRVDGAARLVADADRLVVVGDTSRLVVDDHLMAIERVDHDLAVICEGADPVWIRDADGWTALGAGATLPAIDERIDEPRCSVIDGEPWLAGFDGPDAVVIGYVGTAPVTTRLPWDSGRRPTVAGYRGDVVLVADERRVISATTATTVDDVVAPHITWCSDRSETPTSPCREPRATFEAPVPVARAPIDVVWDERSVTIVERHGWLHVRPTRDRTSLRARAHHRLDGVVFGADAAIGAALVCETTGATSRWTLQSLESGEAIALIDVDGVCVDDAPSGDGPLFGTTASSIVEPAGQRSLRATTLASLGLEGRTLLGATSAVGRSGRRFVLTRRFDAACPVARFELLQVVTGEPAHLISDLGCATDAALGELRLADGTSGLVIDLEDASGRVALGFRASGHAAAIVQVPVGARRIDRLTLGDGRASFDDPEVGHRWDVANGVAASAPLLVTDAGTHRAWLDADGVVLERDGDRLRIQRAGVHVLCDDGVGAVATPEWSHRIAGHFGTRAGVDAAARWFGPPVLEGESERRRPLLDRFGAWREQFRERRASRSQEAHSTLD